MKIKLHITITCMLTMSLACISCSDNSTGSSNSDSAHASFTVSGDVEAQHEGRADFRSFEMSGIHTWDILIMDVQSRTFEISFILLPSDEPIPRPDTGTYDIGVASESTFSATYSDRSQSQPRDFITTTGENTGTLVITRSTDEVIEATFEFTATSYDGDETVFPIHLMEQQYAEEKNMPTQAHLLLTSQPKSS